MCKENRILDASGNYFLNSNGLNVSIAIDALSSQSIEQLDTETVRDVYNILSK